MAFFIPQTTSNVIKNSELIDAVDTSEPLKMTKVWTWTRYVCLEVVRVAPKVVDVDLDLLTLKSASGASRSLVNNCGGD